MPHSNDETAYPVFSQFKDLTVDFQNSGKSSESFYYPFDTCIYMSAMNPQKIVPVFGEIGTLTFNVNTNVIIHGANGYHNDSNLCVDGGTAIDLPNGKLIINELNGYLNIQGGDGVDGKDGADGSHGTKSSPEGHHGTDGGISTKGGTAVNIKSLIVIPENSRYLVTLSGGDGGDGGDGGNGGDGYECLLNFLGGLKQASGSGGNGGFASNGSDGGYALKTQQLQGNMLLLSFSKGKGGSAGNHGIGGAKGQCDSLFHSPKGVNGTTPNTPVYHGKNRFVELAGEEIVQDGIYFTEKDGNLTVEIGFQTQTMRMQGTRYVFNAEAQDNFITAFERDAARLQITLPSGSWLNASTKIRLYLDYILDSSTLGEEYLRSVCRSYRVDYELYPWTEGNSD